MIFSLSASFQAPVAGATHGLTIPDVPLPDELIGARGLFGGVWERQRAAGCTGCGSAGQAASSSRALGIGEFFSQTGDVVASVSQEVLVGPLRRD